LALPEGLCSFALLLEVLEAALPAAGEPAALPLLPAALLGLLEGLLLLLAAAEAEAAGEAEEEEEEAEGL
jgi:hypothetical protein